jgi:hypothetical protein
VYSPDIDLESVLLTVGAMRPVEFTASCTSSTSPFVTVASKSSAGAATVGCSSRGLALLLNGPASTQLTACHPASGKCS